MSPEPEPIAHRRWVVRLLVVVAVALVPWTLVLGAKLPSEHVSRHWDAAWVGFDVAIVCALGATAFGILRRAAWLQTAAAIGGTLLLTDAWFDNLLANGHGERVAAGVEAALGELPLALLCLWVARNAERATAAVMRALEARPEVATSPTQSAKPGRRR